MQKTDFPFEIIIGEDGMIHLIFITSYLLVIIFHLMLDKFLKRAIIETKIELAFLYKEISEKEYRDTLKMINMTIVDRYYFIKFLYKHKMKNLLLKLLGKHLYDFYKIN